MAWRLYQVETAGVGEDTVQQQKAGEVARGNSSGSKKADDSKSTPGFGLAWCYPVMKNGEK